MTPSDPTRAETIAFLDGLLLYFKYHLRDQLTSVESQPVFADFLFDLPSNKSLMEATQDRWSQVKEVILAGPRPVTPIVAQAWLDASAWLLDPVDFHAQFEMDDPEDVFRDWDAKIRAMNDLYEDFETDPDKVPLRVFRKW